MKESTLIEMKNRVDSITILLNRIINEQQRLTEMTIGTLELIKLMPDYERALDNLKKNNLEEIKKNKEHVESHVGEG
jgi:hypothetical protein